LDRQFWVELFLGRPFSAVWAVSLAALHEMSTKASSLGCGVCFIFLIFLLSNNVGLFTTVVPQRILR
jgi:hypothetical protein